MKKKIFLTFEKKNFFNVYRLAEGSKPKIFEESSEDEDEKETLEERGRKLQFFSYRDNLFINYIYIYIL